MPAVRLELLPLGAQTASGSGGWQAVPNASMATVFVNVTANSGTTPTLSVYIEGSDDGATTAYALLADFGVEIITTGDPNGTAFTTPRVFIVNAITTTNQKCQATYKHLAADYVRARWEIGGTTPSYTFSVKLVGK